MMRAIATLALSLLPAGAYADLVFEHGGHTYKLVETPATWDDARAAAEAMSLGGQPGYLARIDSAAENTALLEAALNHLSEEQLAESMANDDSGAAFIWLGGSDAAQEGRWAWVNNDEQFWAGDFNGSPVAGRFANWGVQPDNANGDEDSLAMGLGDWPDPFYDLGATGQWNDLKSDNALFYVVEFDAVKEPMKVALNEPLNNGVHSGVGMIRGWALSGERIERIEVFINGRYAYDIPYGDPRPDVGKAFPESDTAATSGFSVPFRYSALNAGTNTISVLVTDQFGDRMERSATFEVVRFEKPYISNAETPDLNWSYTTSFSDYITIRGAEVGDRIYTVKLQWQTGTQKFEIIDIIPD